VTGAVSAIAAAYSATGAAWQRGPGVIYDRLSEVVVGACPIGLAGRLVLDLGAGTGAASRALTRVGSRVVAADAAEGMLHPDRQTRPPAAVADARILPFPAASFDAVVAAFSLNHLNDPETGLAEAARVIRPGGAIVASSYAADDAHPVKEAVDAAAGERGWAAPTWYADLKARALEKLDRPERMAAAARAAGLAGAGVTHHRVDFADLSAADLVRWRLGMAHLAPFVAGLDRESAAGLEARALELLGPEPPPLRRSILVLAVVTP
jgi:SAM-dependent methyltransferase